jgi:hypothetical protein
VSKRWTVGWFRNGEYERIAEGHSRIRGVMVLLICLNARPDSPHVFRWEP